MDETMVSVENLGKCYRLRHMRSGEKAASYRRLNEEVGAFFKGMWRQLPFSKEISEQKDFEDFWALRGVSLELKRGDRLGIIGRNGAGKSTLLRLLSRITTPTEGRFRIKGTLASLLEVGTGFHPELTGRENIYLNGSILGMSRQEIDRRYDQIVEFSGVERFLDTPTKRFSSGMQVRLAFSIAAHLQTEVMIVDEVLAVGDARFQKKCLGKMNEVARTSDRTILFVSHTMNAVESLCSRAIYLDAGRVTLDSTNVREAIDTYLLQNDEGAGEHEWRNPGSVLDTPSFRPLSLRVVSSPTVQNSQPVQLALEIDLKHPDPRLMLGLAIFTEDNQLITISYATDIDAELPVKMKAGPQTLFCQLPVHFFNEGSYRVELCARMHQGEEYTDLSRCPVSVHFTVRGGLSESAYWISRRPGFCAPLLDWSLG